MASPRRYDIDRLRVLAMLGVFFFHNARFFDALPWHVKNAEKSDAAFVFVGFLSLWIMPLMMLLAGAGSWFALRSHTAGAYVRERALRLLVPLYGVGLFVLIPPQLFWDRVTNGEWHGSFVEFYPKFFETFGWTPGFHFLDFWTGHLWFLRMLFLFSLAGLPLLLALRSGRGARVVSALARACEHRGVVFLFGIPIAAVQIGLKPLWPGDHAGAEFFFLLAFFLLGYLLVADERFTRAVVRHALASGILAAAGTAALLYLVFGCKYAGWQRPDWSPACGVFFGVAALTSWSWVLHFLGLGARFLNFDSNALAYANEAVLPFYVLHQTAILAVGSYVVTWDAAMGVKYAVITAASFVLIMLLYELAIRRVSWLRRLFGMRRAQSATVQAPRT